MISALVRGVGTIFVAILLGALVQGGILVLFYLWDPSLVADIGWRHWADRQGHFVTGLAIGWLLWKRRVLET